MVIPPPATSRPCHYSQHPSVSHSRNHRDCGGRWRSQAPPPISSPDQLPFLPLCSHPVLPVGTLKVAPSGFTEEVEQKYFSQILKPIWSTRIHLVFKPRVVDSPLWVCSAAAAAAGHPQVGSFFTLPSLPYPEPGIPMRGHFPHPAQPPAPLPGLPLIIAAHIPYPAANACPAVLHQMAFLT